MIYDWLNHFDCYKKRISQFFRGNFILIGSIKYILARTEETIQISRNYSTARIFFLRILLNTGTWSIFKKKLASINFDVLNSILKQISTNCQEKMDRRNRSPNPNHYLFIRTKWVIFFCFINNEQFFLFFNIVQPRKKQ